MKVLADKIPQDLKEFPQWVCWRVEERDGKPTKPPVNPRTGGYASCDDPASWTTFDEACQAVEKLNAAGIGFVFTERDPFTGVDVDKCRDPQTGVLEPEALILVNSLLSYTESSPSEKGIHILVRGGLPPGPRRKGRIEMYDTGRYFTVTGWHLPGTPETIQDRGAQLEVIHRELFGEQKLSNQGGATQSGNELSDDALIEKITGSKQGEKFGLLWSGDWLEHYPSQSEADLALCEILAFWTGKDHERINRIFRQSALYRPKWNEKHYADGRTYGQATIGAAISNTTETWKGQGKQESPGQNEPVFVHASQLPEGKPGEYAIDGHLPRPARVILAGPPESGKTWDLLHIALCLASGKPYMSRFATTQNGGVLIIDQESGPERLRNRLSRMALGLGLRLADLPIWVASMKGIRLDTREGLEAVRRAAGEHSASFLGIDSLIRIHQGRENTSEDMARLFHGLDKLGDLIKLFCIVAHSKKPQPGFFYEDKLQLIRGSTDITAWIDVGYFFEQRRGVYVCETVKFRDAQRPLPFEFSLMDREQDGGLIVQYNGEAAKVLGKLEETMNRILEILSNGIEWQKKDITTSTGESPKQIGRALDMLVDTGKILRVRRGLYRLKET